MKIKLGGTSSGLGRHNPRLRGVGSRDLTPAGVNSDEEALKNDKRELDPRRNSDRGRDQKPKNVASSSQWAPGKPSFFGNSVVDGPVLNEPMRADASSFRSATTRSTGKRRATD